MAFNSGLSGIRAASKGLDVIGNNVANSATTGFKSSRTEFGDVYNSSVLGASAVSGSGVAINAITQQFNQGNTKAAGGSLNMAVDGNGFFQVNDKGVIAYTRDGSFREDRDGNIINAAGQKLRGYLLNTDGSVSGAVGDLKIDKTNIQPKATSLVDLSVNLNSSSPIPSVATFDADDSDSYNFVFQTNVLDSQGNSHSLNSYFVKTAANQWTVHVKIDGRDVGGAAGTNPATPASFDIQFDSSGNYDAANSDAISIANWSPKDAAGADNGAVNPSPFTVNLSTSKQHKDNFALIKSGQDGFATGRFTKLEVDNSGTIFARYSNGQAKPLGQVALASFSNLNGLRPLGNSSWAETFASGPANVSRPGTASLGFVKSGFLEESDVNLTEELVKLILAQRDFQANAQTIRTEDAVTQTIINLR